MSSPKIKRRELLAFSAWSLMTAGIGRAENYHIGDAGALFLSAASDNNGQHWVTGLQISHEGSVLRFKHLLPGRAHHIAINAESGIYIVVARRPGTWLFQGDLASGELLQRWDVPADRHLYGHGVFNEAGDRFYTTESAFDNRTEDNGKIGVWKITKPDNSEMLPEAPLNSALEISRVTEYSTAGIGPHELAFLPDNQTLVIANGGLRTHPDTGREVLNRDTMLPSLVYLDGESGRLLEQVYLPDQYSQASIRHFDINKEGQVALGMQFEGEPFLEVPLIATHKRGQELSLLLAEPAIQSLMQQYVGSVRFDNSGRFFAASCPRGNQITFWDSNTGQCLYSVRSRDGCGVCASGDGFVFTAGTGRVNFINLVEQNVQPLAFAEDPDLKWDNHLSAVAHMSEAG